MTDFCVNQTSCRPPKSLERLHHASSAPKSADASQKVGASGYSDHVGGQDQRRWRPVSPRKDVNLHHPLCWTNILCSVNFWTSTATVVTAGSPGRQRSSSRTNCARSAGKKIHPPRHTAQNKRISPHTPRAGFIRRSNFCFRGVGKICDKRSASPRRTVRPVIVWEMLFFLFCFFFNSHHTHCALYAVGRGACLLRSYTVLQ